jgi:hypothetical protein
MTTSPSRLTRPAALRRPPRALPAPCHGFREGSADNEQGPRPVVAILTRQTGEVMKRSILGVCAAAALALTACGGASDATTTEASPTTERDLDGTQNYATVAELHEAVNGRNTSAPCGELQEERNPTVAAAQGTCAIDDDDQLVLQLWDDAKHRDDGTTDLIMLLSGSGLDYCYVLGRGEGDEAPGP